MRNYTIALSLTSLIIAGCGDDHSKQVQAQGYPNGYPSYNHEQYQPQMVQPQVVQPQVIQAPAQPVVIQQQDNTLTNMAVGAMIGHTIGNMVGGSSNNSPQVVERHTVIVNNPPTSVPNNVTPNNFAGSSPQNFDSSRSITPNIQPSPPKTSAMDMNKLSESAKQTFNTNSTPLNIPKTNAMDMSKLNTSRSVVSTPRTSSMNMSKLSRR